MNTDSQLPKDSLYPPILAETLARPSGLVLMTGQRQSGMEQTVQNLLRAQPRRSNEDLVVVEGLINAELLRKCLFQAEEGRLVVLLQKAPSPLAALRRLLSEDFGEGRRHILWRLCDQMLLMAGQWRLKALGENDSVDAFEILLMTPVLKKYLENENFEALEEHLKSSDETAGVVSFNQALLQLLLRRKVDIKTAFEATRDPGHLDQILKKVGI